MTDKMTDARLIELIEAWGADTAAFPQAEQAGARALLARSPERFAQALEAARAVDSLLGSVPDISPTPAFMAALVHAGPKAGPERRNWFALLPGWPAAGALASLAIGLVIGLSTFTPATEATTEDAVDTLVYAALGFDALSYNQEAAQ